MNKMTKDLLDFYVACGFSVIPIAKNSKKPTISWTKYQSTKPTKEELSLWFASDKNIAIITGNISNLSVIDCDSEASFNELTEGVDLSLAWIVRTPNGGKHIYFRYTPELKTQANPSLKIDVRNNGGYVLAPPSTIDDKQYVFEQLHDRLGEVPPIIIERINGKKQENNIRFSESNLLEGGRDEGLFHLAYTLAKGGMGFDEIFEALKPYAKMCKPPFPEKDLKAKIISALRRLNEKPLSLTEEVLQYVKQTNGVFSYRDVCKDLNVFSTADKKNVSKILSQLSEQGILEKSGSWNATYRLRQNDLTPINLKRTELPTPLDLRFPFELENLVKIYPKNIIVVAGTQNVGKTLFFLNFVKMNQDKFPIHYFNSEMSEEEMILRLNQFGDVEWNFNAYTRSQNFTDVIRPNEINIIDYLEVADEFWKVGRALSDIHEKLDKGICLVGLQKSPKTLLGRGASFGLEKPRLYLSMDRNKLVILKAKNWAGQINPNYKAVDFYIDGTEFVITSDWYDYEENGKE